MAALQTNPAKLQHNRTEQAMLYLREYWNIADEMVRAINGSILSGALLASKLNSATAVRTNIAASFAGADGDGTKADMAAQFGHVDIAADITAANQASNAMLSEMDSLITVVTADRQLVTANDTVGRVDTIIVSPETDALLAACVNLRDGGFIASPNG